MSDDMRRRRRLTPNGPRRASGGGGNFAPWAYTILAAIVVIAGGWFLGQAIAHAFNSPRETQVAHTTPAPSPSLAATAAPSPSETPSPAPTPTLKPSPTPQAVAAVTASPVAAPAQTAPPATAVPTQLPTATPAPTAAPVSQPTAAPVRRTQPVVSRPEATPAQAQPQNPAEQTVVSYIDALRRGDPQTASSYLGNGTPDESFIGADTRISSVSTTRNADGSYKVAVDMKTANGEYFETFTVAATANGNRILDKTAIRP